MNDEHKNALERSLLDIGLELDAEDVFLYLRAKGIVKEEQVQEIMKITRRSMQNMQLVDFIKGAGPSAFQEFINALQACNKECLAEKILARLPSSSTQQSTSCEMNTTDTFDNRNNQGRMVGGLISGGSVNQGDIHDNSQYTNTNVTSHNYGAGMNLSGHFTGERPTIIQNYHRYGSGPAPSTSSSTPIQSSAESWQQILVTAQQSLKEMYLKRFKETNPFSLPFTFHIENMWVSVALSEGAYRSQATEDHAELLRKAFAKQKMLVIEGNPASGKTSLMRRLAYEWAIGKQELSCYDLVLYAEFRKVREKRFESIVELVLYYSKTLLKKESYEKLEKLMNNERFCEEHRILVLLDGYDESSFEKPCSELRTYLFETVVGRALLFNVIITTRKGYLSHLHGRRGRFVFAEVLGFTTKQQKEKYISSHFLSSEIDNKDNILAVHSLLNNNHNLNKLAETPLFLTFICLVHERIVDGTLLELYCNIIWWLIDRHQQDFPDRDIPALFGFQNGSSDRFETIQEHYLHFPQLHCLGKMALRSLQENVFKPSHCNQFNMQPIIEQVGLLRKEKKHDKAFKLETSFLFTHRTIQEFLAAFYYFCSNDPTSERLLSNSKLDTFDKSARNPSGMTEFSRFLLRIALSDTMPVQAEKRKYYFDRITDIKLDLTFDAFNTTAGFNNKLLNWFLSQCTNVQNITLNRERDSKKPTRNMLNDTSIHNDTTIMSSPTLFNFGDLIKLQSVTIGGSLSSNGCTFSAGSQLSFSNCPSLKNLTFGGCEMKSSTIVGIATLPAIDTAHFWLCNTDLATWQSITDQIRNSNVKYLKLTFGKGFIKEFLVHLQQCNSTEQMDITIEQFTVRQNDLLSFNDLIKLYSLTLSRCTLSAGSQLSFSNCPSLKDLIFVSCEMEGSTIVGIATLPAIDTVHFDGCKIDLATWQSITDQISNSNVKYLHLSADFFVGETYPGFLRHLHKCDHIQQIRVNDSNILNEESVTANLALAAQTLPALTSITILAKRGYRLDERWRLSEKNRERIEKAGQQTNPTFSIKYVES